MWLYIVLMALVLHVEPVESFDPITPSLSPLKYISLDAIGQYLLENGREALISTVLPVDRQDAVAIFIAEGTSGVLGGVAGKIVSTIDGNKNNRESTQVNAQLSGLYFGVSATVEQLAQIAGFSSILVNVVALLTGVVISEGLKFRYRSIQPQVKRVGDGPSMKELMDFQRPKMSKIMKFGRIADSSGMNSSLQTSTSEGTQASSRTKLTVIEIYADLMKWFMIYFLSPRSVTTDLTDYVIIGAVAGILSQLVREQSDRKDADEERQRNREAIAALREQRLSINDAFIDQSNRNRRQVFWSKGYLRLLGYSSTASIGVRKSRTGDSSSSSSRLTTSASNTRTTFSSGKSRDNSNNNKLTQMGMDLSGKRSKPVVKVMPRPRRLQRQDFALTRIARTALETAVQLVTYEASRRYVMAIAPYFNSAARGDLSDISMLLSGTGIINSSNGIGGDVGSALSSTINVIKIPASDYGVSENALAFLRLLGDSYNSNVAFIPSSIANFLPH